MPVTAPRCAGCTRSADPAAPSRNGDAPVRKRGRRRFRRGCRLRHLSTRRSPRTARTTSSPRAPSSSSGTTHAPGERRRLEHECGGARGRRTLARSRGGTAGAAPGAGTHAPGSPCGDVRRRGHTRSVSTISADVVHPCLLPLPVRPGGTLVAGGPLAGERRRPREDAGASAFARVTRGLGSSDALHDEGDVVAAEPEGVVERRDVAARGACGARRARRRGRSWGRSRRC